MSGIFYIIGTPIGNLGDMTFRQIETLKEVDFICAEDTRVTLKLLNRYDIKNHLVSFHEHSSRSDAQRIIDRIIGTPERPIPRSAPGIRSMIPHRKYVTVV